MKIAYCSDVHLEFGGLTLKNTQGADLLILAGDIIVAKDIFPPGKHLQDYIAFFDSVAAEFPKTIYIAGNHEHYHGDMAQSKLFIQQLLDRYHNIQFMDNEMETINGFNIFAGTMWTNFNNGNPLAMATAEGGMNDYRIIHMEGREFTPSKALAIHEDYIAKLQGIMDGTTPTLVVSHHGPTTMSVHPRYKDANQLNWAYHSDLSELILDNPQIKLWFHGHTHHVQDYMVGSTRVLCNPRGYHGYEAIEQHFELLYTDTDNLIAND